MQETTGNVAQTINKLTICKLNDSLESLLHECPLALIFIISQYFLQEIHTRAAAHVNKPPEQTAAAAAGVKKEEPAETPPPPVNGASTKTEAPEASE